MYPPFPEDDTGALERARERLYEPDASLRARPPLARAGAPELPHEWEEKESPLKVYLPSRGARHVRLAGIFFIAAFAFFLVSISVVGYLFYFGGNTVSVDKVTIAVQGPTTVSGGDIVPLSLTITNKNPVALENATIEIDFPSGTRSASDVLVAYPRYVENLGELASGASVTRSIKAVMFGGAGQSLALPVSLSYGTAGSNAVFVKKSSYTLAVSSTPLSITVDAVTETVSGQPLSFNLSVRSNATVALSNVVLTSVLPFGFSVISSSVPINNSSFLLGTIAPGATKHVTLTGRLTGQDKEQRVFHFTVGTANTATDQTPAVAYMTQDASVTITSPFINASLALNGDTSSNSVITSGRRQNVTVSYTNTLPTSITNATVAIGLSGSAIDYNSIQTSSGFYRSSDHTIVFSRDTDPALAALAPGASGIGTFTFSTLPPDALSAAPTVVLTTSVSGTRVGQTNVPEEVNSSSTKTIKVATSVAFTAVALHSAGLLTNSGPIPPKADQATTYSVVLSARNSGSAVAGGTATTILPSYVSYTGITSSASAFSYNEASRTVTWSSGDLAQGGSAQGTFQVSLTPSSSQKGDIPNLTGPISFSGYDRFAGVQITANVDPVTTDTKDDPGYTPSKALVQ
ncbi:MAG: hypothetical protein PHV99_01375 [Candidatus Pacebacteria bacterium]|nr:hypothetical protein [Candidatus Paceibacterota bacterium]